MEDTYDAFDGQRFYERTMSNGGKSVGPNSPDRSIVGYIDTHLGYGEKLVQFFDYIQVSPVGICHAYNACGHDGVPAFKQLLNHPEVAAWYATKPQLVETPWASIPVQQATEPVRPEEQALLIALRNWLSVQK